MFSFAIATLCLSKVQASDFANAASLWRQFEMPVPPRDAVLVLVKRLDQPKSNPAFAYLDHWNKHSGPIYVGGWRVSGADYDVERTSPYGSREPFDQRIAPTGHFLESSLVSTTIQSVILGRDDVANVIFGQIQPPKDWSETGWIGVPNDRSLTAYCAFLIATNLVNQYLEGKVGDQIILNKLRKLRETGLIVAPNVSDPRDLTNLISELESSMLPSNSEPGTPQFAVDDLVHFRKPYKKRYGWPQFDQGNLPKRIAEQGIDVTPNLAAEMNRHRLTRTFYNNHVLSTAELSLDLVLAIAKGDLGTWTDERFALEWYEAKKAGKVEEWLMDRVSRMSGAYPSDKSALDAIAYVHPRLLGLALQKARDEGLLPSQAEGFIEIAALSSREKRELVLQVVDTFDIEEAADAINTVEPYSRETYDDLIMRFLDPSVPQFDVYCTEIFPLLNGTKNSRVWHQAEIALFGASPERRIMMLQAMLFKYSWRAGGVDRPRVLAILTKCFDDPAMVNWMNYGFHTPTIPSLHGLISVGRVAVASAAVLMNIYNGDMSKLTENDWAEIRQKLDRHDYSPLRRPKLLRGIQAIPVGN